MTSKQEKAFQELIEMSEELGLYKLDWIDNPLVRKHENDVQLEGESE
jgi:hypothetical protein